MMKPTMMYTANKKRIFKNANGRMVTMNSQNTAVPAFLARNGKMVPLPPRKNTQSMKCNPCMMKAAVNKMKAVNSQLMANKNMKAAVNKMKAVHSQIMAKKNMKAVKKVNITPVMPEMLKNTATSFFNYNLRPIFISNRDRFFVRDGADKRYKPKARFERTSNGGLKKLTKVNMNRIPKEIRPARLA
jgi:hypothetical protein